MMEQENKAVVGSGDDGCAVDWGWLKGRVVASATSTLDRLVIRFEDGETLTVQTSLWKGQPFLAFTPWKGKEGAG
jgi:hypothetical protein